MNNLTMRVGLAVDSTSLRAVGVRRGEVQWSLEAQVDEGEPLDMAIVALLSTVSLPMWPRVRVVAAIGPSQSQVKQLAGLPDVSDRSALDRIVQESAGRFFLSYGIPLVTTGLSSDPDGGMWGAALEQPVVESIVAACRRLPVRLAAVIPAVVVLPAAFEDELVSWVDGPVEMLARYRGGRIAVLERVERGGSRSVADDLTLPIAVDRATSLTPREDLNGPHESRQEQWQPHPIPALAVLGDQAWRFADAFGAAMVSRTAPLAFAPGAGAARPGTSSRGRRAVAAACCCIAIALALAGPAVVAVRQERAATTRLALLADERRIAVEAERELATASGALAEVANFSAQRRSVTLLLGGLAQELPDGSAIVALRVDSVGGNVVVLAGQAGTVLARLERVPGIIAPELVGPVTREIAGTREVERASVRFRLAVPSSSSSAADTPVRALAKAAGGIE